MSSQVLATASQTEAQRLDVSVFPREVIRNQVDMLVEQRRKQLEAENQILSSQIHHLGKRLRNERRDRMKYQELLVESNTCIQDINHRMRRVCEEVEEQKKANLHLIDLMRGDHCGPSKPADPTQEEICGDRDDLSNVAAESQPSNKEPPQDGGGTGGNPVADFATD